MILIGDVHGKFNAYKKIIREHKYSIQVGDMGVGFKSARGWKEFSANPPFDLMVKQEARFIRGNHDNPEVCRKHQRCILDGTIEAGVMFCGGADSIDKQWRTEGFDWWADEELSISEFWKVRDTFVSNKPEIMITHEAPFEITKLIHGSHHFGEGSRTQMAFQSMWEAHQPRLWVHGHHHISNDVTVNGTRFVCLAELEVRDLD